MLVTPWVTGLWFLVVITALSGLMFGNSVLVRP